MWPSLAAAALKLKARLLMCGQLFLGRKLNAIDIQTDPAPSRKPMMRTGMVLQDCYA